MNQKKVENILIRDLNFNSVAINKLRIFHDEILLFNKRYNLISKNTEGDIWYRHILDSAQLIKYIDFSDNDSLADLGSGAGLPGIVLSIFNDNEKFHVKLYDKSNVKCEFLNKVVKKLDIKAKIINGLINQQNIDSKYVICRAFRKLDHILGISRESIKVNHKLIILKGKNALKEINELPEKVKYRYELNKSITNEESKIIIFDIKKNTK